MNHAAIRSQELNPASLTTLYRKEFQLCRVAAGETIAVVSDLNSGEDRNPDLRHLVGSLAYKFHSDARALSWSDLKQRADGPTFSATARSSARVEFSILA